MLTLWKFIEVLTITYHDVNWFALIGYWFSSFVTNGGEMLSGYRIIVASQWRHAQEWKTNMPPSPSVVSRITKVKVLAASGGQIVHFCNSELRYQFVGRFENWRFWGRILMKAENVFDCHEMITIFLILPSKMRRAQLGQKISIFSCTDGSSVLL